MESNTHRKPEPLWAQNVDLALTLVLQEPDRDSGLFIESSAAEKFKSTLKTRLLFSAFLFNLSSFLLQADDFSLIFIYETNIYYLLNLCVQPRLFLNVINDICDLSKRSSSGFVQRLIKNVTQQENDPCSCSVILLFSWIRPTK